MPPSLITTVGCCPCAQLGRNETESFVQLLPEDDGDDGLLQANRTLVTYPTAVACVAKETGMSSEQTWEMVIGVVITLVVTAFLGWCVPRARSRFRSLSFRDPRASKRVAGCAQVRQEAARPDG
eukprot:SAG11_NODE_1345_length_5147_cov_3.840729_11_plen_124_part_00